MFIQIHENILKLYLLPYKKLIISIFLNIIFRIIYSPSLIHK